MVETYIKETVDTKNWSNLAGFGENVGGSVSGKVTAIAGSEDVPAESGHVIGAG